MTSRETARVVLGGLLLAGTVVFSLPLSSGYWDPVWLRVAEPVVVDTTPHQAEVGDVLAPFEVVQRTLTGEVHWRLRGQRVQSAGDLYAHTVAEPRLWIREGDVTATVKAEGGRVRVLEEGESPRLDLEGDVVIEVTQDPLQGSKQEGAFAVLRTAALTLWVRQEAGPDRVRVECPGALTLEATQPGRAPWTARAASLEGRFAPLELALRGPVHFAGAPEALGPVRGVAREVRFSGLGGDAEDPLPTRVDVVADDVRLEELAVNAQPWTGEAEQVSASFERSPGGGDPGGKQSASLVAFEARGEAGVRLAQQAGPGRVRAEWLRWKAEVEAGRVELAGLDGVVTDVEGGKHPSPWGLRAERGVARVRRALFGASLREALISAELSGEVDLRRLADDAAPGERRRLRADRLSYAEGRVSATGQPARLVLGESELDAPSLAYDPDSGDLEASDLVYRASFPRGRGEPQRIEIRATHGEAIVSSDREAWRRQQLARKALRRDGSSLFLLPRPLAALRLRGEGARRLRVSGNHGLAAEGDRFAYDHERGWASLTASAGRSPARLAWGGSTLRARRIEVQRTESQGVGRGSYWVSAGGEVEASGLMPARAEAGQSKPESRATLSSAWIFAELREQSGAEAGSDALALGGFEAGGEGGVTLGLGEVEEGGRLEAKALRGSGARRTADGRPLLDLELDGPWGCQLVLPKQGPARLRGGQGLALSLDQQALRAERWESSGLPEAALRRVLCELRASGGLELVARDLRVRAERADYDPEQGAYILRGNPAFVSRRGVSQKTNVYVLRLADE